MYTAEDAMHLLLKNKMIFNTKECPLLESLGLVLNEDIHADRNFPPFDRSTMDGIAIQYDVLTNGHRDFLIQSTQFAGSPQQILINQYHCIEVMTGAMLPKNTDTIIPYEQIHIKNNIASIIKFPDRKGQYIHIEAKDVKKGDLLLKAGKRISLADIGLLATVGKAAVTVTEYPSVAIVSTGDELVDIHQTPAVYQIRKSNVYVLAAALQKEGIKAAIFHLEDNKVKIKEKMEEILANFGIILLSGGVSMGKKDFIPTILEELNATKVFHKIAQRPGKPFWFGKTTNNKVVFAFPGNPVSTFVCYQVYFKSWLLNSLGIVIQKQYAELGEDIIFPPKLTYFMLAKTHWDKNKRVVFKLATSGSGDLKAMASADGILMLPEGKTTYKKGEIYLFFSLIYE